MVRRLMGVAALTALGCASPAAPPESASGTERVGAPPDFELDSLDGDAFRLGDHVGSSVVLLDFWATFCSPCLAAMPHLDALYRRYREQGFVVAGISIDGPDSVAQVQAQVEKLHVSFPILLDQESRVVSLYNPKNTAPFSVLIGRNGTILRQREGYTTGDSDALESDIIAALEAR